MSIALNAATQVQIKQNLISPLVIKIVFCAETSGQKVAQAICDKDKVNE